MESQNQAKHKLKINNSYESEPSSGSGSYLGDQNEGPMSDEENIQFPYLVKPQNASKSNEIDEKNNDSSFSYEFDDSKIDRKNRKMVLGRPAHSSQESAFEGFGDTPSDESLRDPYDDYLLKYSRSVKKSSQKGESSSSKSGFPKYFNAMVEENSCNAVDMQLSNEPVIVQRSTSCPIFQDSKHLSDLSFNGKIKSLNAQTRESIRESHSTFVSNEENCKYLSQQNEKLNPLQPKNSNVLEISMNTSQFTESFILKKYRNERSPDLFGDDEEDENEAHEKEESERKPDHVEETLGEDRNSKEPVLNENIDSSVNGSLHCQTETSYADEATMDSSTQASNSDPLTLFRNNCRKERELLKRIKKCLAGVPPPPSFTIPQLDMFSAVLDKKTEIFNFFNSKNIDKTTSVSACNDDYGKNILFKPSHSLEEAKSMGWREILGVRHHGVCYNLNKASEINEYLTLSVVDRFIGAETASSYRNSPSSAKKRISRLKMLSQSPGNRLSHLAKRRAIFSSANLATTSLKSTTSLGPQILIDKKKAKNRRKGTPKRMTPGSKNKNRKTPSSACKRVYRTDMIKAAPSRETSKRALFQSPAKQHQQKVMNSKPIIKPEIAIRVEKSKRALFSPDISMPSENSSSKASSVVSSTTPLLKTKQFVAKDSPQLETFLKRKRNYTDDDDEDLTAPSSKLFRGNGENLTPRALKIKSQSFCIGAGSSMTTANGNISSSSFTAQHKGLSSSQMSMSSTDNRGLLKMQRAHSDMATPAANNLTENQRKKLLWAVSQALQEKKISSKHENFKQYASVLARVVKRIFTEYYQRSSTSNSETMLRLAKKYAYNVISGKNVDDIYLQAKSQIDVNKLQSSSRLSGYIGPEEYQKLQLSQQLSQSQTSNFSGSMHNLFSTENSIDSFNVTLSQPSSRLCPGSNSSFSSQTKNNFLEHVSQEKLMTQSSLPKSSSKQQPIQIISTLQNSSSKSNLGGLALRENVDGDRRSAQKNFTGKDQRNVSPYAHTSTSNNSRSLLGSGLKAQTEFLSDVHSSGGKVKRQILFDS